MSIKDARVGMLGGGSMASAMIRGLLQTGLVPAASIAATDVHADRLDQLVKQHGIRPAASNDALVRECDVIVLAIGPESVDAVLKEIAPAVDDRKLLISIVAGVSVRSLRSALGKSARLIRVMPNIPILVLEGVTAIARAEGLEAGDLETAQELFGAVGRVVVLHEDALDAATGLSGSGPAYVAIMIESLADGGVKMGLDRATALALAAQTVAGTAKLILDTGIHPGQLKDVLALPGGAAIAGIGALETGGLRAAMIRAVEQATEHSRAAHRPASLVAARPGRERLPSTHQSGTPELADSISALVALQREPRMYTVFPNAYDPAQVKRRRVRDYLAVVDLVDNQLIRIVQTPLDDPAIRSEVDEVLHRTLVALWQSYPRPRYDIVMGRGDLHTLHSYLAAVQGWERVYLEELSISSVGTS